MIVQSEPEATIANRDLERNESRSSLVLTDQCLTMSINTYSHSQLSRNIHQQRFNNEYVIGIVFVQDVFVPDHQKESNQVPLGTIILNDHVPTNASILRENIQKSLFKMDENYVFLTKFDSPISIDQEIYIELGHLITLENTIKFKRKSGPDRCSLIGYYSNNSGIFIGYVYASYDMNLKNIRNIVDSKLKEMKTINMKLDTNYHFLHSFGCIISQYNESDMILIDIIRNNCILIKFEKPIDTDTRYFTSSQDQSLKKFIDDIPNNMLVEGRSDSFIIRNKTPKTLFRRKTVKRRNTIKTAQKQIMISYVRREAAEHAIQLKKSLLKCGFSVYLDVHEIQMGSDWQDSLNAAVQNCHFFVPLITQNYGRTQWTNREIKLADLLQKHIIPINFLDLWPPECLAIQFATTQYIPWNSKSSEHNQDNDLIRENDTKIWNVESIETVTKLIEERISRLSQKNKLSTSDWDDKQSIPLNGNSNQTLKSTNKELIVISAHPEQSHVSESIKSFLLNDFDVWCSNDTTNVVVSSSKLINDVSSSNQSDQDLTPIIEESSTITRPVQDYAKYIAENSKQRPKSVPSHEKLDIKKKDLVRVFSCGESSYEKTSSISPDKMIRLKYFHKKVLQSSLVIILASNQYYKSSTSKQHVYYCEQRVKTILVQYDKSPAPVWFSKLMSHDHPLNYGSCTFKEDLLNRIGRTLDPHCKEMEKDFHEVKIKYLADCMKKNILNPETCVYVFGSTETSNLKPRTAQICKEIGKELAKFRNINIVTNGFYGTGDIVAHTFYQERCSKPEKSVESVIHIVPLRDNKNLNGQNSDNTFQKVSYGQTLFLGQSIKERDSVIARMLDTSVLIAGDQNAVREVEEIIWNDHFVIPVKSTGGAAGGEYDVPQKIFSCPNGVRENQWAILSEPDATPHQVAKAVVNVIYDLKKAIHEHAISKNVTNIRKSFSDRPLKKRIVGKKILSYNFKDEEMDKISNMQESPTPEKVLPTFPQKNMTFTENIDNKIGFKRRFNRLFKRIIGY